MRDDVLINADANHKTSTVYNYKANVLRVNGSLRNRFLVASCSHRHTKITPKSCWINLKSDCSYLPLFDWFGTKQWSVWIRINRKMVNTIWFQVDLIRFRNDFTVCSLQIRHDEKSTDKRLTSLGILGNNQTLKPPNMIVLLWSEGFRWTLYLA